MKATDAEVYVVVGACGFLGTALCKYLLDRNCVVVGLDIKLTNIVTVLTMAIRRFRPGVG